MLAYNGPGEESFLPATVKISPVFVTGLYAVYVTPRAVAVISLLISNSSPGSILTPTAEIF